MPSLLMTDAEAREYESLDFVSAVNRLVMWFINHIEIPAANRIMRKGDVHVYSRADIQRLCDASGMELELYEVRKGMRLHCVVRKPG